MRAVINNDLNKGGHLSAQPMGALFNFVADNRKRARRTSIISPFSRIILIKRTPLNWRT
jgi:hypothetical protein